jgi:hypothetical protein
MVARTITLSERTAVIREALLNADSVVLQDLLEGVHDRVVVAITFLAMLELVQAPRDHSRAEDCRGARSLPGASAKTSEKARPR